MDGLDSVLRTNIADTIDPDVVGRLLSSKPFLMVDGVFNIRDLSDSSHPALKSRTVLRSGSLEGSSPKGEDDLKQLGVKTIFDLRSVEEIIAHPDPVISGIEVIHAPIDSNWHVKAMEAGSGPAELASMYVYMLETNKPSWQAILRHIRDAPSCTFLLHCTAGKDRTGAAAALIMALAGLPSEYISRDYALTRIGIEPVRGVLASKLPGGKHIDLRSSPVLHKLAGSRAEDMAITLRRMDEKYGSVQVFAKRALEFSVEDIARMRANLAG